MITSRINWHKSEASRLRSEARTSTKSTLARLSLLRQAEDHIQKAEVLEKALQISRETQAERVAS